MLFPIEKINHIVNPHDPKYHINEAHTLAPISLLKEMGLDIEYHNAYEATAYWACLDYLGQMSRWIEEQAREEEEYELSPEFWAHLAQAAYMLKFSDAIPFWIGKALQMPYRSDYEALAALMVWGKIWEEIFENEHPELKKELQSLTETICGLHKEYNSIRQLDSFIRIAKKLEEGNVPMHSLKGKAVESAQQKYFDLLYPVCQILIKENVPQHLIDLAWPIVHRAEYGIHEE